MIALSKSYPVLVQLAHDVDVGRGVAGGGRAGDVRDGGEAGEGGGAGGVAGEGGRVEGACEGG